MSNKTRILIKAGKKAAIKVTHIGHKNFYKGMDFPTTLIKAAGYPFRHGMRPTVSKLKKELRRVANNNGVKHQFPNGMVSGVNVSEIYSWKPTHKVSIVIPSYNDYPLLSKCVTSIHATCKDMEYEVIIVDDYCQEENREKLRTLADEKTRIIFREQNGGFSKAVNTGLREVPATHDAVLLNSDIEAHPNWLKALQYGAYVFGDDIGIVGPKLLYPDGRIQSAGSYRNTEEREWFDHYYRFQAEDYGPANVPQFCLGITGACQYVTRKFMNEVGILDEGFPFAFEDMDWCLRGWEAGYKTLYFPASTLTHHESASRAKNKNISERERGSVVYFWQKWGDWFDARNVKDEDGRIKVVFVLQTMGWSGGIKIVVEHANRMLDNGFATEIWGLENKTVWPNKVPIRGFKNYEQLTAALEKEEAIKVATWWETATPVWMASLKKGIAVNFIQEIESWFYPNDPDAQRTVIASYRKEFINMTTSSYNEEEIGQLGLKAIRIPCGYDDKIYFNKPTVKKEENVLLTVGRSFFQKNLDFTLRGWKALKAKRPDLWMFGSEPDLADKDTRIKYYTKPSDDEVNDLYNKATVFIQTSRHEGFCLPLLEAMSTGTPVICTDAHGNRDFCHDGKTCLLVEHDNDAQLTAAINRLFADKKLREKLSKNSLKEVEAYTWPNVTKQVVKFYADVAAQNPIESKVKAKYGKR